MADDWEDVKKKSASTATADDWEDVSSEKEKEEPTEENLPGSTERLRSAVSSGVAKMQPPTKFEKERTPEGSALYRGAKAFGSDVLGAIHGSGEALLNGPTGMMASAPAQAAQMYLADQQRKESGYSPLYRGAAALGSVTGVVDPSGMEEAATHGDTAGVVGHTVLPAVGALAGADQALGGKVTGAISKIPGQVAGKALDALGHPLTLGAEGAEMLTKGVRPRARATGWQDAVQSPGVQRAIQEYHAETPIKGVEDFKDAVPQIKERLWDEKIQPALDRQGPRPVDMKPVAEKVRRAITPQMREFDPNGVQAMEDLASKLEKSRTVSEASDLNKYANAQLESYFNKYPTARRSALASQPETMGWENARSAIREQLGKTLEDAGEMETQPARKDYGHLTAIEKELERKVNVNDRSKPTGLYNFLGSMGGIGALLTGHGPLAAGLYGAGKLMEHFNSPDVLVRRGIEKLNPPEAPPFTPPASFVPPPPAAQTAQIPRMAGEQVPLNLPPENAPLFNIQQTPKVAAPPMEMMPPIQGTQQELPLPPENAPLFNIQQTPRVGEPPAPIAPPPEGGRLPPIGGPGREGVLEPISKGQPIGNQEPLTVHGVTFGGGEHLGPGLGIEHTISVGGRRVGSITVEPRDEGVLHVHWLGGEFGREMRQPIMDAIHEAYPETKKITYDRRRLARGAESATTEPREMNVKPMIPPKF